MQIGKKMMKVTSQQIDILDKLLDAEVNGDDPSLNKREKKELMKQIRKNNEIPDEWRYEIMEAIGCYCTTELTDTKQQIIHPIYDGLSMQQISRPPVENTKKQQK